MIILQQNFSGYTIEPFLSEKVGKNRHLVSNANNKKLLESSMHLHCIHFIQQYKFKILKKGSIWVCIYLV